jgi:hypothetical protein
MAPPSSTSTVEAGPTGSVGGHRPRRRRRWVALGVLAVVVVAAVVVIATVQPFTTDSPPTTGVADNADPTSLATVARQDLSSQTEVAATLGYAGSYSVVNQAQGTVTVLPAVGQVVTQGQSSTGWTATPLCSSSARPPPTAPYRRGTRRRM